MFTDIWDKLWEILHRESEAYTVYVYRLDANERPVEPYLLKYSAWSCLPDLLCDEYGGGGFRVIVRHRRTTVLSGSIWIEVPLTRQAVNYRDTQGAYKN